MEERKKNLCAMIPESLHKKVREEQEEWGRDGKRNQDTGISGIRGVFSEVKKIPQKDRTEPERICDRTD